MVSFIKWILQATLIGEGKLLHIFHYQRKSAVMTTQQQLQHKATVDCKKKYTNEKNMSVKTTSAEECLYQLN